MVAETNTKTKSLSSDVNSVKAKVEMHDNTLGTLKQGLAIQETSIHKA